jgi:hypothetical protein
MRYFLSMVVAIVAAVIAATGALGGSMSDAAAAKPTLAVVVVGAGRVTSTPAGISCPGRCVATFSAGSRVLLTQKARTGSRFLRWGGSCTGAGACRVRVSALSALAAQFVGGSTTKPVPTPTPPAKGTIQSGTYSGRGTGGYAVTFFVPAGVGSVLDFSTAGIAARVNCAGGGSYDNPFTILKVTIKPDGSFTGTTSQSAVVSGKAATITYNLTGRFQGTSASGATTAVGAYREDIVFADMPSLKCTSNDQPWTASRSLLSPKGPIQSGTYSGRGTGGYQVTFAVPAGGGSVLDFSTAGIAARVNCAGGGSYDNPFKVVKATIKPDGSFTGTTSQSAVVSGKTATITYSVTGYFQSENAAGATTAGGVYREDIVFADTPAHRCTSNDQPWTAARTG